MGLWIGRLEDYRRDPAGSATPATVLLAAAIARLGKVGTDIAARRGEPETGLQPGVPEWLVQVLTTVVNMPRAEVDRLSEEQAREIWHADTRSPADRTIPTDPPGPDTARAQP